MPERPWGKIRPSPLEDEDPDSMSKGLTGSIKRAFDGSRKPSTQDGVGSRPLKINPDNKLLSQPGGDVVGSKERREKPLVEETEPGKSDFLGSPIQRGVDGVLNDETLK